MRKVSIFNFQFSINNKGFTLVEVLVVVAIISILMTIMLPNFNTARLKGKDAKRKANMKQIQAALEMYKADQSNKLYPTNPGVVTKTGTNVLSALSLNYLPQFPTDPADPLYQFYYYTTDGGITYTLCGYLEYEADSEINSLCSGVPANSCVANCNYGLRNP